MEQDNKLKEAVTQLTSSHNVNTLAARSTSDQENSDNTDSGEDNGQNERRNTETDCSLYN